MKYSKRDQRVSFPMHRGSRVGAATPDPPASTDLYLHTSGVQIKDKNNTEFLMRGAQWVGFNQAGVAYSFTPPYTESNPNPLTGHGDAWQLISTYKLNTVRLGINWHMVERNVPTALGGGVYKHDWTDNAGVINPAWDTPDGYLTALDDAIRDIRNQGGRVILELQQSQWSPGCDPVNGVGLPSWLYTTKTDPSSTASQEVSAAKWEFFQASGGWARSGVPGPPQDLMVDFWKFICTRYKDDDTVVGIDFLNEPGWPTAHPFPSSVSGLANPSAPTDVKLVAFYQKCINAAAAIQPLWLLIYENGTYANKAAGRAPLTTSTTPPTGSNLVMSWHYYPENPNAADGNGVAPPLVAGTAPTLAQVNTFISYLTDMVSLAQSTFGHPFWVGETSMFHHLEQTFAKRDFDYTDTVYSSSYSLWEKLFRDFLAYCTTNHVSWAIWAFQRGAGRSFLNTDGTPKTDFLSAIGATPDPPPVVELGPTVAIRWVSTAVPGDSGAIVSNLFTSADSHWESPQWVALYYDAGLFGRGASGRTTPTQVLATADVTINSDGTLAGTTITGTTFGTGFVKSGSDGAVVITCNAQVNSLTVNGPTNAAQLLITGKLWSINKNLDTSDTRQGYAATFNDTDPGGFVDFESCTVALTNFLSRGAAGKDPGIRFQSCRAKDSSTPFVDGFLCEYVTRDWLKPGGSNLDLWMRHGTVAAHPYADVITDPVGKGSLPLINNQSPPTWSAGTTYSQWQCVKDPGSTHKFYSLTNSNVGNTLPTGLGSNNANWQFYGDLHSDGIQAFLSKNTQSRGVAENVFFLWMNHAALYTEEGTKVGTYWNDQDYQWNSSKAYKAANPTTTWTDNSGAVKAASHIGSPDLVRASDGHQYYCVADNTNVNPTTDNGTHWALANTIGSYLRYCLIVGNAEAVANGCEDPTNGARECLFARSFNSKPVQGTKSNNNANGIQTTWVVDPTSLGGAAQTRGILNINNVWGDTGTPIDGSAIV
jgi:hypothetical protein